MNTLLSGWTSGTPGQYLENTFGFQNMKNKILLSKQTESIELNQSRVHQDFVSFIDTDFEYSFQPGLVDDTDSFDRMTSVTSDFKMCYTPFPDQRNWHDWTTAGGLPGQRNNFYDLQAHRGDSRDCGKSDYYSFSWGSEPGWLASNTGSNAIQFHLVYGYSSVFDNSTEGRSTKNVGGVWTMCGDNFTQWLETTVPRPPSCDDTTISPACSL
jgi:hypothetical protein